MMSFHAAKLAFARFLASSANTATSAVAAPDAQGWGDAGWYITGSALPAPLSAAAPDYILFEGPHVLQSGCLDVYDRLYSLIGVCRFLDAKPAAFAE